MTAGGPRSARYVDPTTREMAEDLARRSGLSLNEWVSRLMAEGPEDATSQDYFSQPSAAYVESPRPASEGRYEAVSHPADEVTRVAQAIERLSDRIQSSENRQAMAIAGIERSVREVIERIDAAEREQMQVAARFEGDSQGVRGETAQLAERLRQVESDVAEAPRSAEALRALEGAIGKVAGHVFESEQRSREALDELGERVERIGEAGQAAAGAIEDLKTSCAALDGRLNLAEGDAGAGAGIEQIAANLSARVEATRDELSRQLATAANARFDRVEQALAQMTDHVRDAEQRSAYAVERMGREVLEVAQTLNRRVQAVETHSAEAADRLGAEMSRIAGAVETRLSRADSMQAQALEKLGAEIARITERLADRISNAERRSAQAIDDVGEQVARVTERIGQRHERATNELADRIRQSEERTARLLDEARQRIDERLAETQRRLAETRPPVPAVRDAFLDEDPDESLFGEAPFPGFEARNERSYARPASTSFGGPKPAPEPVTFEEEDFEAASAFHEPPAAAPEPSPSSAPEPGPSASALSEPAPDADFESAELEPNIGFDVDDELLGPSPRVGEGRPPASPAPAAAALTEEEPVENPAAPLTTREVIERARAAARATTDRDGGAKARPSPRPADEGVLRALTFGRSRKRPGGPGGPLMVAGVLAMLGLSAGGYVFLEGKPTGRLPKRVADALAADRDGQAGGPAAGGPLAAVALAPTPTGAVPAASTAAPDLSQLYSAAVAKLTAGEAGGLVDIRKLADQDYAPAQFYLGELYQDGRDGLKKDPAQSRQWLQRAADGGDRAAMHNLALDYHQGVGGPRNAAVAAEWFRRAAELGLLDSQFNLAALYEHGDGVSQNAAEAYKWYLIAARAGDVESKAAALRVRAELSPDERAVAERAAADFQPTRPAQAGSTAAAAPAPSPDLVTAQRALSQLGYYQGPTDGLPSPALRLALAAYQRDQSLPVTGAPDVATIGKLSVYTR